MKVADKLNAELLLSYLQYEGYGTFSGTNSVSV